MNVTRQERMIAAATYVFDLGYVLNWFLNANDKSSLFLQFHFEQASRIVRRVGIPGVICLLAGLFIGPKFFGATLYLLIPALLLGIVALFLNARAAYYAYKGQLKKVI